MVKTSGLFKRGGVFLVLTVIVAGLTISISELAYRGARDGLNELVKMGAARFTLQSLVQRVTDAETAQRGYIITSRREYMEPYQSAAADARSALATLRQTYTELGLDEALLLCRRLEDDVNEKLDELESVLALIERQRLDEARAMILTGFGLRQMDRIRADTRELQELQAELFTAHLGSVFDTLSLNRVGVSVMTLIIVLMLLRFRRQSRLLDEQRVAKAQAIKAERDQLEAEVRRRTAELTELAGHLQLAREDERAHLARELHDELGALLTAAKLDVARMRPKLQLVSSDLSGRLEHLTETLNAVIALKRRIIEDLRPSTLDNLGLCPALEILCRDFASRMDVGVQPDLQPVRLSRSAQLTAFRIVQETLTNISKYAKARHVDVSLREEDGMARVRIRDDGVGFDPERTAHTRHGLRGMRFRVEAERGTLTITSSPGAGSVIEAALPLEADVPDSYDT